MNNGDANSVVGTMKAAGTQAGKKKRKDGHQKEVNKDAARKVKGARLQEAGYDASTHRGVKAVQDQRQRAAKSTQAYRGTLQVR